MSIKTMSTNELKRARTDAQFAYTLQYGTLQEKIELVNALEAECTRRQDSQRAAEEWRAGNEPK